MKLRSTMIHLAIDTDVWLYLVTVGFDKDHNLFDEFCYWLELGEIRCIVSEQIVEEWERNKESKVSNIKTSIAASVGQLKNTPVIQDRKFFQRVFNSDNFEASARARLAKVEEILTNYTEVAPVTESMMLEAGRRTRKRIAPSHMKDSYSDAINILAIVARIQELNLSLVTFVSKNYQDYSEVGNKDKLHPDLIPMFDEVALTYAADVDELFHKILRPQLSSFADHLIRQKEQRKAIEQQVSIQLKEQLANTDEDYIINTAMLEQMLQQPRPSHFQEKMIGDLIDNDEYCRKYFFNKLEKPGWLPFVEKSGYLNPSSHPGPLETSNGQAISRWESLHFLEKLSSNNDFGKYPDLQTSVQQILTNISTARVDNDLTHASLIRILSNLPSEFLTLEILDEIPGWFSPKSNKMLPTSAICQHLLPKLINETATPGDMAKGEKILKYLFSVSLIGTEIDNTPEKTDTSFYANAHPWTLAETLVRKEMLDTIAKRCSSDLFFELARTIRLLVLDYPRGLQLAIKTGDTTFEIKVRIQIDDVILSFQGRGITESSTTKIEAFHLLDREQLKKVVLEKLALLGIDYEDLPENDNAIRSLLIVLTIDRLSIGGSDSIAEMNINRAHSKHFRHLYSIILIKYLSAISFADPEKANEISHTLYFDSRYKLPIFRRIVLHNMAQHFETQRSLLMEILDPKNPNILFDDYTYRKEVFNLLRTIQRQLNDTESKLLQKVIAAGPKEDEKNNETYIAYWQYRWYLALNQVQPFTEHYRRLAENFELTDREVDPNRTMQIRSGTVIPITSDDLLNMSDDDMLSYIMAFNPKDRWDEPNIEGMAASLKAAVLEHPTRFTAMLDKLLVLPYIYTYHILYAFLDTGRKENTELDWKAVINFCCNYISQPDFAAEARFLPADGWQADQHWVLGVISYLISDLCRLDEIVQQNELLNVCESTLFAINSHSVVSDREEPQHRDYITHSFNSDNGKFLRACMDFCLCNSRLKLGDNPSFPASFKMIFENYLAGGSIDAYSIIGYYWQQFNYLDHKWLRYQFGELSNVPELSWQAFMGGFLFAHAPGTSELLNIMLPQYQRAIDEQLNNKVTGTNGFATQMATLYLWQMLDLADGGLLVNYLSEMPLEAINDFLHVLYFSPSFFEALADSSYESAEKEVLKLTDFLFLHYGKSDISEVLEMLRSTVNILYMVRTLNKENTAVISRAIGLATKQYHYDDLFEPLHKLMGAGQSKTTAVYLANIFDLMSFGEYVHLLPEDVTRITELIQFLYKEKQRQIADKICNRLMVAGQLFAKAIYEQNNLN
ncbi:hypothetical protein FHW89_001666 [Mucilaginibacter sp. SG564]|nr:hypothetical protein [Mucilaginibacter sp. SG564]